MQIKFIREKKSKRNSHPIFAIEEIRNKFNLNRNNNIKIITDVKRNKIGYQLPFRHPSLSIYMDKLSYSNPKFDYLPS